MRLAGKVAVITGAASGIGKAAALLFAKEGAKVVVADWNAEGAQETVAAIKDTGGDATSVHADLSQNAEVANVFKQCQDTYGALHILYNNAGIGYSTPITLGDAVELPEENWDRVLAINLKSVYLCCKHGIPAMIESGGGAIVNTSSVMGLGSVPGADAYTAAKGGIIAMTRSLAKKYGEKGIRVNVIAPGSIATPMIAHLLQDEEGREKRSRVPLGRVGQPEDIAYAALYLASDESSFVTGAVLFVDGGATI